MCFEKLETNVLSAIYSVFIWAGVRHLFIPYLLIDEIATKHPQEKILGPRNTHEKKFWPKKYHKKNFSTHDIPRRKNFGPRRYPREKIWTHKIPTIKNILDQWNTLEKKCWTHKGTVARWHESHKTHDGRRPTEFNTLAKIVCGIYDIISRISSTEICIK